METYMGTLDCNDVIDWQLILQNISKFEKNLTKNEMLNMKIR